MPANRALYARQLDEMHQLRARYFVEERGWADRTTHAGGEFDDLDDDRALYLFSIEDDGSIALSARLRPADDKSMLVDCFPELLAEPAARVKAPGVWELSRYFAAPRYRGPEGLKRNMELRTAVVATAQRQGARRIIAVTDVYLMNTVIRTGWDHRFLGLPATYAHGEAIAFEVVPSLRSIEALMERHGLSEPLLLEARREDAGLEPHELEVFAKAAAVLSRRDLHVLTKIVEKVAESDQAEQGADGMLDRVRAALLR
jgi:N-acyl-L-homoserine lactone synthetase